MSADTSKKAPPLAAFISYAKPDFEKAQEIADQLEAHGFKCWIAPRDVRPGRAYGDEIIRGIERAQAFVLVLSSASNGSGFVSREIERAVSKNKHIFTIRIEDVQPAPALELFISSTQWIDAFKGRLGPHIDRLAQQLADDDDVSTPADLQKTVARAESGSAWRSPLVLGGGALAAAAILLGGAWLLWPKGDPSADYETCLSDTPEAPLEACDRAIASGEFTGRQAARLLLRRGYERHIKDDLPGALADYNESAKLDPTSAMLYNNRGMVHRDSGDFDPALTDFDRAIALDPNYADALASRGWIYLQKGETERARADIERALALNPRADLKAKLEAALARAGGPSAVPAASEASEVGLFGTDTRKALREFPEDVQKQLAAAYAHVGALVRGHSAVCNATLVGPNLILTSDYCFDGSGVGNYSFRIRGPEGRMLESAITQTAVSEVIRGVNGKQRISLAVLATPLGDEVGFVERVGGEPAVGDRLDIVALDVRPNAADSEIKISGAATGDTNCTVLEREADTDIFAHRCISPEGSGGAPIFDAATGTLVGIVGESGPQSSYAYRTTAVPGLIQQTATAASR